MVADDPKAREVLRQAFEKTARWQKDFKGFTADLTVNVNGKETSGPVMVKGPREVSVQLGETDVQKWVQEQLGMIAVHRGPRSFRGIGRQVRINDGRRWAPIRHETYHPRVELVLSLKDNRITQINRKMAHPGMTPFAFTINVEESATTQDQKNLTAKVQRVLLFTHRREADQRGKLHRHPCAHRIIGSAGHPPHHYIRKRRSDREDLDIHESQVTMTKEMRWSWLTKQTR